MSLLLQDLQKIKPQLKANKALKKADLDAFFKDFAKTLPKWIKKTICCYGIQKIKDPEEQKKLMDKLLKAIEKAIPSPYDLAWPLIKPIVKIVVEKAFKAAVKQGDKYCEGVTCSVAPFSLTL